MPAKSGVQLTPGASDVAITAGRYTGALASGKVLAVTNLAAGNIKYGVTLGGVAGTFSEFANGATAAQILAGRSASVNGATVNGSIVDKSGANAASNYYVISSPGVGLSLLAPTGFYDGSNDTVYLLDADFIAANIKSGVNLFGVAGTYNNAPTIAASDNLKASADTERTNQTTTWTKYKQMTILFGGTIRVKFGLRGWSGNYAAYGRIYKNGAAVGTSQGTSSINVVTYSEDISVSAGDLIQLYSAAEITNEGARVSNFRVYYDINNSIPTNITD